MTTTEVNGVGKNKSLGYQTYAGIVDLSYYINFEVMTGACIYGN